MGRERILIPVEKHIAGHFEQENLTGDMVVNASLLDFKERHIFSWQLSLLVACDNCSEDGLPNDEEREVLASWAAQLDEAFKVSVAELNALFLARVTWNNSFELVYRIHKPEITDEYIRGLMEREEHPRPFDYRIESDPEWALSTWFLKGVEGKEQPE